MVSNAPMMAFPLEGEVVGNAPVKEAFQLDGIDNIVLEKVGHVHASDNCMLVPSGMFQWPS